MAMTKDELLTLIDQAAAEGWTDLDLSGNELTELPEAIGHLTQLERLTLGKGKKHEDGSQQWGYTIINGQQCLIPSVIGNAIKKLPDCLADLKNLHYLDISGNPVGEIPDWIDQLINLKTLVALTSEIKYISPKLAQLSSLQELHLSGNQITEIPDFLAQLSSLQELHLSGNQITEIPDFLAQLSSLQELHLSGNQITEIPDFLAQLSSLQELNLSSNQITEIPNFLAQLSSLQELHLSSNQITEIPDFLAQLSLLQHLDLSGNQITEIPEALAQLSLLQHLNLNRNQIRKIPDFLAQLSSLQELNLGDNQITEIPEALAQLSLLQHLFLYSNQIAKIPNSLARLISLQTLYLFNNQITEIPDSLTQLTSLQELQLDNNKITIIPDSLEQLSSLQRLDIDNNEIKKIPDSLAQLKLFHTLYLQSNQITEIPDSLAQLSSLRQLYLGGNQITEIPDCLAQISSLQKLYLDNNRITEIPDFLAQLSSLQELHLSSNQITSVPETLEQMLELTTLDLRGNPLPISPEILGTEDGSGSVIDILNYCRQLRSGDVRPLNEAKLILVGQGSVGKTSLINRLINNHFDSNEPQTDGLNVSNWQVSVNNKDIRLNVWDFGGQEIYHATHQFFLTKRSLYLLVCNCRTSEEENRLDYWLKLIQSFGDKSPVIIVGNKRDEQPLDINRKALQEKYPNIKAILETSCQTSDGIKELSQAIIKEVGQLREVYDLLPLAWFEVKEQLEAMDKDFIGYSEYVGICYSNSIIDELNQIQLIGLLHNLGLVLNYRDHPLLQNTNVLNPDWVTQGIYTLLSDDDLKTESKGQLTLADLTRILPNDRYPESRHNYLIELMKEFQLCFQLPECSPERYLIPGILPKEEPKETGLRGETLEFQYHYTVLPDSVISRFIVLVHDKIHEQTYWRSGVMLAYGKGDDANIARVRSDPADNKIFIAISGNKSTRREFLAIIRDVFNKIHSSFTKPTEWVPVPRHPKHPPLDYQELLGLEVMGEQEYPIGKLRIKVNLRQLLDGYESLAQRQENQLNSDGDPKEQININIYNENKQQQIQKREQTSMTTFNNQGANIGNQVGTAKNNAQITASNFIQGNGITSEELLQLIEKLRQNISQFTPDDQEELIIDLEDVETEVQKPENQRNQKKLQRRLTALFTAGLAIAGSGAATTDFLNNVTDLGEKVGIELPQIPDSTQAPQSPQP